MNYSDAEIRKQGQLVKKRNHNNNNNNKGKDQTLLSYSNKKKKKMLRHERKRYPLLCFWELPEYMKDNEYILRYYRANWPLKQALFSVFRWHNETLNVWTHLLGFLLFLGLTLANLMKPGVVDLLGLFSRSFSSSAEKNVSQSFKDLFLGTTTILFDLKQQAPMKMEPKSLDLVIAARWPFYVFLCGSMFCLLSSSICHLFSCHSHSLNLFLLRIDYVGITVMIITSFFPQIYYVFLCQPHWQLLYLAGITAMGLFTIATLLSPTLSTGKYRGFRAMLFCSMGLFGIVPAIHASIVNWGNPRRNVTLAYECTMALSYLIGTLFYVTRVPERWKPGWFDIAGHSHQIFHVLVIVGALAHYAATLKMLDWRDNFGCDNGTGIAQ
ncbi:heptahelical transmembrane protein 1-like [Arachis stenosperma]|uniref:heptahelical transmembrane protein 1-like n=1 Tax=Arachis stenosperma TaxID=217475 RepID=UPI0025AC0C34|nr:heptahelical transmembrane protein 1-like [Arachis stenosperma]